MSGPAPIRVLVVEDSSTVRKVVVDALSSDPEITVVGTAANGKLGLVELQRLEPDLITLDIEMPEMDGLTMLTELRKTYARVPVIMVSTLTGRGAAATLDALARGASDYVTKPSSATATTATSAIEHFRRELIPRVKALCPRRAPMVASPRPLRPNSVAAAGRMSRPLGVPATSGTPAAAAASTPANIATRPSRAGRFDILAIGCSTGGPNAIEQVLSSLPGDFPTPILLTQHMPPIFTKMLADRLNQKCALTVVEASDGMEVVPGTVYVAPGDYHMVLKRSGAGLVVGTNQAPPENSCRPAVDVMFRSVAEVVGGPTFAVVMTGMGYDGRVGSAAIAAAGGEIIVQDQATSVVWGMPGAVADAGLASEILPLDQIAHAIDRRFNRRPGAFAMAGSRPGATARPAPGPAPAPAARPAASAPSGPTAPAAHTAPTTRNAPTTRPINPPRPLAPGARPAAVGAPRTVPAARVADVPRRASGAMR